MNKSLATLRDRKIKSTQFRMATEIVSTVLARKMALLIKKRNIDPKRIALVAILRSGVALIAGSMRAFPGAPIGMLGMKRDERTYVPCMYYCNLPKISRRSVVIILDPMLATGGSAGAAVDYLEQKGILPSNIYFLGVVAAPEGLFRLSGRIPRHNIILASVDKKLDPKKMIVPGLGDFGDRYFGTL